MKVIGVIIIAISVCVGIYLGVWWALIGGIITLIHQFHSTNIDSLVLGLAIVKIAFFELIGIISGSIVAFPGIMLLKTQIMRNWWS